MSEHQEIIVNQKMDLEEIALKMLTHEEDTQAYEAGQLYLQQHEQHHGYHTHSEEHKKKVLNRLSRAIGHMESVKRMVEENRDCNEVLIQLLAVEAAVKNTGKEIIKEHLQYCIKDAVLLQDESYIEEFMKTINRFV